MLEPYLRHTIVCVSSLPYSSSNDVFSIATKKGELQTKGVHDESVNYTIAHLKYKFKIFGEDTFLIQ